MLLCMTTDNKHRNIGYYDSICTCKECHHKMAKYCFEFDCRCCKIDDHSMIMNGIKGFETTKK